MTRDRAWRYRNHLTSTLNKMAKQRFSRPDFTISFDRLDRFTITAEDAKWAEGNIKKAVMAGIVFEAGRMAKRNRCRAGEFFLETSVERIYERAGLSGGGHNSYSGPFKAAVEHACGEYVRGHGAVLPSLFDGTSPKGSLTVKLEYCKAFGIKGALIIAAIGNGCFHQAFMGPVVYSNTYIHNRLMGLMSRNTMENTIRELEEYGVVKDVREKFGKQYRVWNMLQDHKLAKLAKGVIERRKDELETRIPNKQVRMEIAEQVERSQRGLRRGTLSMAEYCEQRMLDKLEDAIDSSPERLEAAVERHPIEAYAIAGGDDMLTRAANSFMAQMVKSGVSPDELYDRLHKALSEAGRMRSVRIGYKARIKARIQRAGGSMRRFIGAGNATMKRMRDNLIPWGARGVAARRTLAMAT